MKHTRILRTVAFITTGYLILLSLWLNLFYPNSAEGTEGFQVMFLVCLYGAVLGAGMLIADRTTREDRKIERDGLEGWATIRSATPLGSVVGHVQRTELDLDLMVPGSEPYSGKVVFEAEHRDLPRLTAGQVVSVLVDPDDRTRILIFP
ncbi:MULTISPECIES: hypothetical protein [unclassified Rhodococcus (in: high G+C Gram-positive bacteria)]|uniref:hypothetical protein n=1 Tax=Rhodococcus sp. SJ-3 TaxID=3454628 RepID=UPI002DABA480|nr:hypothetical protein [Rhodococcus sp. (in: high G+C Gram-positive bacteria)]